MKRPEVSLAVRAAHPVAASELSLSEGGSFLVPVSSPLEESPCPPPSVPGIAASTPLVAPSGTLRSGTVVFVLGSSPTHAPTVTAAAAATPATRQNRRQRFMRPEIIRIG